MKPIKITTENAAAIEAALKAVNGRATTHTIVYHSELARIAVSAEKRLDNLELPKADRTGARFHYWSGTNLPSSYRGMAIGTEVVLRRMSSGTWVLEDVGQHHFGSHFNPRGRLTLTEARDAKVVEVLRRGYTVARPMTAASAEEVAEIADAANAARHARDVAYAHEGTEA